MRKKVLSIILCIGMMCMLLPVAVSAETLTGEGTQGYSSPELTSSGNATADKVIDDFISANINDSMTLYEKLEAMCIFVSSYDYIADYSRAKDMILKGGGNCWASTEIILIICEKLGINAKARNGNKDPMSGTEHRNAFVTEADGSYYEVDAGYSGTAPRPYEVKKRTSLFSYSYAEFFSTDFKVYQYDGDLSDMKMLEIPSTIDGNTMTMVADDFLTMNDTIEEISIPDTITSIGTNAFNSCKALKTLTIPASVTFIGEGAFGDCSNLREVTFEGTDTLTIDSGAFSGISSDCEFYAANAKSITGAGAPSEITATDTPADPSWPENPFKDVRSGDWYHDSVKYVFENKLMVGTSDTTFAPNTTTNRGMIVTILYRLEKEPSVAGLENFSDVPSGAWYANAVAWAKDKSITVGNGNGNFGAEDDLTREQLAAMFYRYAQEKGDLTENDTALTFKDTAEISDWAEDAIKWCVENGIITGKGNNILDPQGKATRAEMATIIQRFGEKVS